MSQPKALRSRARGYLTELRRATCSVESHSSFCSPFSPAEFLATASNLSSSTATGPDKVAYPMLKHPPRSGMNFLLHIFNLSWSSHSFPSIWKTSSIIPIHKMGKPLDSPASFQPISFTSCISKLFERIILSRCSVSRLALHQAAMPNIFLSFFTFFFLLVCFRLLCVILVFTMCIRVLLLYASKITHTYFYFFIRARLCLFLSSLGSSVIGLPFPPLGCLSVIFFC